jgi:hypothetical protein
VANFSVQVPSELFWLEFLTATATDATGSTSEFSNAIRVLPRRPTATGIVNQLLNFVGTGSADVITVAMSSSDDDLEVTLNGNVTRFPLSEFNGFFIDAALGNDTVNVAENVGIAGVIFGGPGNDIVNGGSSDVLILGGDGNDRLRGGLGNDMLDGEAGNDALLASRGRDSFFPGTGRDSIQLGSLSSSLVSVTTRAVVSIPGSTGSKRARGRPPLINVIAIDTVLDRTYSGTDTFTMYGAAPEPPCTTSLSMAGHGRVTANRINGGAHGDILRSCDPSTGNGKGWGRVEVSGTLSLQKSAITVRATLELWMDGIFSESTVSGKGTLTQVVTNIS